MKQIVFLAVVFSLIINSNGETINCYTCREGFDEVPKDPGTSFPDNIADLPKCSSSVKNSEVTATESDIFACIKLNMEGTTKHEGKIIDASGTARYFLPKGECQILVGVINLGSDVSASCYECDEDRCNVAGKIQISIISMLLLALAMFFI